MDKSQQPVWVPRDTTQTNIAAFINFTNQKHHKSFKTYQDIHRWSTHQSSASKFWADVYAWLELGPPGSNPPKEALSSRSDVELFPPPVYFSNETLNIAEHLLRRGRSDDVAIRFAREGRLVERITWQHLRGRVGKMRDAMVSSGLEAGDVVAAVMSNSVDAIVICLAALSIGAIWSSSSCEMGPSGIIDRYHQIRPRIIFADDGYTYAGKLVRLQDRITQWAQALSSTNDGLRDVVIIPYCNLGIDESKIARGKTLEQFLARARGRKLEFAMVPFAHPAFILFSSGTTGVPKCIVHSGGGVLLKVKTDMVLQNDVKKTDVTFQYTTTSWVMWIINLVNLGCGSSMLLYDGSPFYPSTTTLLQLAQDEKVTVFGTSPKYLSELRARGTVPRKEFKLDHLRILTSTGSALQPDQYTWFYQSAFPQHVHLISMSGGTDIAGSFVSGTPLLPVYAGQIQVKSMGMAIDILDSSQDKAVSVEERGEAGELVCVKPFPSQPLTFFGDGGWEKYRKSYYERYGQSFWHQGDYIQRIDATSGFVILGRSDGVLNPGGVRFGSAEIYAVTETFPQIADCLCIGQRRDIDEDERVLLFVLMKPGETLTKPLEQKLRSSIQQKLSTRHVPQFVFEVGDIPYTVNGKKCEINVKHIVSGRKAAVSGTVANPDALSQFAQFVDLPPNLSKHGNTRSTKL